MLPLGLLSSLGTALPGIIGLFSHPKNPANAANAELNKIPGQVSQYYTPYQEAGKGALSDLQNRYGQMLNNPGALFSTLGEGYKQSPGYAATLREALAGANNAAAMGGAGGLGTPGHEHYAAQAAGDVANKDYEQYINHILGLYQGGLTGEEDINKLGYGANTDYGNLLANIGQQRAQNAFNGVAGRNLANTQNWANIGSGLSAYGTYQQNKPYNDLTLQYLKQLMSQG